MSDTQGHALTIGLNSVNSRRYDGWRGELAPCENDARVMAKIATSQGFKTKILATRQATRRAVRDAIKAAATALGPGDIFMLFFSGHGEQVLDTSGDEGRNGNAREEDDRDETWCLYDGELVDDELYRLWLEFQPGVRIIVFSDSCHSGTILAADSRPARRRPKPRKRVKATVLLISASLDNQNASAGQAGAPNSVFTARLKQVWQDGNFRGGYRAFWKEIRRGLLPNQTSSWYTVGPKNARFFRQRPFTI